MIASLFAGIDGGGSKTLAVVVDDNGEERGRAVAGSSNFTIVGLDQAVAAIQQAVDEAVAAAAGELPVRSAWIGLAGIDRAGARQAFSARLGHLAKTLRLSNDAELVLSALPDAIGVAVIAGTGSIALGRDAGGNAVRAGGWGNIIGDEGSGYELGRLALQAASRAADGRGPETALLDAILRHWDLAQPGDIIARVHREPDKAPIAALSTFVFAAARAGDSISRQLVDHAAAELALAATTVADALTFSDGRVPLALAGGLLVNENELRDAVLDRLRSRQIVDPLTVVAEPALAAAVAAARFV